MEASQNARLQIKVKVVSTLEFFFFYGVKCRHRRSLRSSSSRLPAFFGGKAMFSSQPWDNFWPVVGFVHSHFLVSVQWFIYSHSFIHSFRIFFFLNLQCKFQTLLCANCDVHLLLDLVQRLFPFPGTLGTLPTLTLCSDLRSSSFSAPSPPLPPPPLREPTPPNSS